MKFLGWLTLALFCATAASGKFNRPSEYERLQALGNRFEESDPLRILVTPDDDFPPIHLPRSGDWLAQHPEKGQSFEEYRDARANKPDGIHHVIYLLPIGEFDEESSPPLEEIRAYAAAFFQMEVKLLPAYHPHDLEFEPRKNVRGGQRQILTRSIMTFLKTQLPADAYCLLGITMTSLSGPFVELCLW